MNNDKGILSIGPSYNKNFNKLLRYYDITPGPDEKPVWYGINNIQYGYYACNNYDEQINFYRLYRAASGGLHSKNPVYSDLYDLTESLKLPYKFYIENRWSIPNYIEDNFEYCFAKTVELLCSMNDKINILYSGGVDSSAIVCGFVKYSKKENFNVCFTKESVKEYPLLFDFLLKNGYNVIDLEKHKMADLIGLIVDGSPAGVFEAPYFAKEDILDKPWQSAIKLDEWGELADDMLLLGSKLMDYYGKSNPTVADFKIFIDGMGKPDKYMHLHYEKQLPKEKLFSFFGTEFFRSWHYYHSAKYMINSHLSKNYKIPCKKIIFDLLKDNDYCIHKNKGKSQHLWNIKCNSINGYDDLIDYFFINCDNERVSANSEKEYRTKYGSRFDHYFTT